MIDTDDKTPDDVVAIHRVTKFNDYRFQSNYVPPFKYVKEVVHIFKL